jgi:hypothetical protein
LAGSIDPVGRPIGADDAGREDEAA